MTTTIIPWKGRTFNEIVSVKKKNTGTTTNIFKASPLKLYRREINVDNCNEKINASVSMMETPGATIVNSQASNCSGSRQVVDFHYNENKCESPCSVAGLPFSKSGDALRRVRSSGMNNRNFYSSTKQYLEGRSRTHEQNQYYYVRQGDQTVTPGTPAASQNIYSSNSCSHCETYTFTEDTSFQYQWVDTSENGVHHDVVIPAGTYYDTELNDVLQNAMISNLHYIVEKVGNVRHTMIRFFYNYTMNKMQLAVTPFDNSLFSTNDYELPKDEFGVTVTTWSIPTTTVVPGLNIFNNELVTATGFSAGNYPDPNIGGGIQDLNNVLFISDNTSKIKSRYIPLYYKPNNPQYGQQGAVSSSSRIQRLKYNSITDSAYSYQNAYGKNVANALAYGVPANGYTIKDKIGYPLKCTPKFNTNGTITRCVPKTFANII
jgi:hypothetical protein